MAGLEKELEKLYKEEVDVEGVERVADLQQGVTKEVNFTSKITGIGNKFPNGTDQGKGTMTLLPDGTVDARCKGLVTTDKGDQFEWQSREMSRVVGGKKVNGLDLLTISTKSQDLLWMNDLIVVLEHEYDPSEKKIRQTGYKLK
jgi:hypothetical protein